MKWRNRGLSERVPRPKAARLSDEELQRLHGRAAEFIEESVRHALSSLFPLAFA